MKNFKKVFLLVVFLFSLILSKSQNYDSLFAARERILLAGVDYHRALIKWNFFRVFSNKMDVGFEKKVNLNFSMISNLIFDYDPSRGAVHGFYGYRYYYNLEDRITRRWMREKSKTSCFSADYFEADYGLGWNYGPWDEVEDGLPPGIITGPTLKIGSQRKIAKHFFMDVNFGYNLIFNVKGRAIAELKFGLEIL